MYLEIEIWEIHLLLIFNFNCCFLFVLSHLVAQLEVRQNRKKSKKLKIPKTTVTIVWESLPKHKTKAIVQLIIIFFFCLERGTGK